MGSIKKELLSGVFYTAIAKYSGILISLIITGVLARLISPDKIPNLSGDINLASTPVIINDMRIPEYLAMAV